MLEIPRFNLVLEPKDENAKNMEPFKWAGDKIGKRHQIGGKSEYIDIKDYPLCPSCKNRMSFYGQLDSLNDDYVIADCGLIAVFICFDCIEVKAEIISG